MEDPLTVLRDYTVRGRPDLDSVKQVGDEFHFGDEYRFPCNIETAYRSKHGNLYTLDSLVFFVKHIHTKHTDYMREARAVRLQTVTFIDRKALLDYLEGRVQTTDAIELLPPRDDREYRPDKKRMRLDEAISERERPIRDRNTILLCNKDFLLMLKEAAPAPKEEEKRFSAEELQERKKEETKVFRSANEQKAAHQLTPQRPIGVSHKEGPPISLVPSASRTMLNLCNAKEFLEDGVYAKATAFSEKPESVPLLRKMGRDTPVEYEVRDKPLVLSSKDWERVVAVFVLGKEWQFKDWPFKDHVEIFSKIMAIFLRYEDDSVESANVVKRWNVKILSLSKHNRHRDRTAALEFWDRLDAFIYSRRPSLVF